VRMLWSRVEVVRAGVTGIVMDYKCIPKDS
jgi:hypothetical protein